MQTVKFTMGMGSLKLPQKVRRYVLDWFRHLMNEQGIMADNVSSGKFILTLRNNSDEAPFNYDALYDEITDWAKREFDINIRLTVNHDPTVDLNHFYFVVAISSEIRITSALLISGC